MSEREREREIKERKKDRKKLSSRSINIPLEKLPT